MGDIISGKSEYIISSIRSFTIVRFLSQLGAMSLLFNFLLPSEVNCVVFSRFLPLRMKSLIDVWVRVEL